MFDLNLFRTDPDLITTDLKKRNMDAENPAIVYCEGCYLKEAY